MGSYVVLARKWRPSQFSDIVGQGHIVRTLMNAIRAERIHQAYLFTGSRGIGKTSIARILAKVIRCEQTRTEGDWLKSCDECSSCREITSGSSVDVIEIDGASNNGVDAIREIRENAKYLPATGKRKIYIIDEVHMLTTAAFNALLKTLEEPPPHVIFIFATTEPHKIPATILSRVQRFDFRRANFTQIQGLVSQIATAEGIDVEPAAVALLSRAAEGGMRDALSLLDQVIAFSGTKVTVQNVRDSIGLIEGQALLAILEGVLARKPLDALALVEQAYQQGHDLRVLTRSLIELLHGAVLFKIGSHSTLLELSEEESKELKALTELRSLEEIELIFQVLHHGLEWIARSPQPKIVLDVLLVKCATAEALVYVGAGTNSGEPSKGAKPAETVVAASPAKLAPAPPAKTMNAAAPAPAAPAVAPTVKNWEGLIEQVRKSRPLLASILEHGNCDSLPGEGDARLLVHFSPDDAYFKEQLQAKAYSDQLNNFCKEYFGRPVVVRLELKEGGESLAAKRDRESREKLESARKAVKTHPIIQEAKALFGTELGTIEVLEGNTGDNHASAP